MPQKPLHHLQASRRRAQSSFERRTRAIGSLTGSAPFDKRLSTSELCKRCQAISPSWFLYSLRTGGKVLTHSRRASFVSSCELCELLRNALLTIADVGTKTYSEDSRFEIWLSRRGFEIAAGASLRKTQADTVVSIDPSLCILQSDLVDFNIVKRWLRLCSEHSPSCTV